MVACIVERFEIADSVCDGRHDLCIRVLVGRCLTVHGDGHVLKISCCDLNIQSLADNQGIIVEYQGVYCGCFYEIDIFLIGEIVISVCILVSDAQSDLTFFAVGDRHSVYRISHTIVRCGISTVNFRDRMKIQEILCHRLKFFLV